MSIGRGTLAASVAVGLISASAAGLGQDQPPAARQNQQEAVTEAQSDVTEGRLSQIARQATAAYRVPAAAEAVGYALSSGCVSGPEEGAMGVHYGNAGLLEDGVLDASQPEVLVYEPRNGRLQLAAVEYVVVAEQWDASNDHPPILHGQHFHYVPAPNRAGLPAHYELHVWAWKRNPNGTFADYNPRVRCDSYAPDEG